MWTVDGSSAQLSMEPSSHSISHILQSVRIPFYGEDLRMQKFWWLSRLWDLDPRLWTLEPLPPKWPRLAWILKCAWALVEGHAAGLE